MKTKHCVHDKVLVVGTTADYIDWLQKAYPQRALFLTEPAVRQSAKERPPDPADEILASLDNFSDLKRRVKTHLKNWNQKITGVACFDCEAMETAAMLAPVFKVDYPDIQAVKNCRDKYLSKQIWEENGISCPSICPVNSVEDVTGFLKKHTKGIVLKPFSGSGSELIFRCQTPKECEQAFETIKKGLSDRRENRLFTQSSSKGHLMLAEEYIAGPEYSCDFIIENKKIKIIRLSRKIKSNDRPFGTVSGYVLPASLPGHTDISGFKTALLNAAVSLGLTRAVCMVDFIMKGCLPLFIEMTPRPGGDCLPFLLREAGGLDILGLTLDFAQKTTLTINGSMPLFKTHIGLRLHADRPGVFKGFDTSVLSGDKRVKQIHIIREPGHRVIMPPQDYDSWLLGHIIIEPDNDNYPETQSLLIRQRLRAGMQ